MYFFFAQLNIHSIYDFNLVLLKFDQFLGNNILAQLVSYFIFTNSNFAIVF